MKSRSAAPQDPVQTARNLLEFSLKQMDSHPRKGLARQNAISKTTSAIRALTGVSAQNFRDPFPVVVEITGIGPASASLFLKIRYVDPAGDATGFYLLGAHGNKTPYPDLLKSWADTAQTVRDNALIDAPIGIIIDSATESALNNTPYRGPTLHLTAAELQQGVKLGFLTKEGKETEATEICYAPQEITGWSTNDPSTQE